MKQSEDGIHYLEGEDQAKLDEYTKTLAEDIGKMRITPNYEGAWNSTKVYNKMSVVVYEENSYIAKVNKIPVGTKPTNKNYYDLYIDNSVGKSNKERIETLEENVDKNAADISKINTNIENLQNDVKEIASKRIKKFGVRYYFGQTSSKLERIHDSVGLVANATKNGQEVINNFDNEPIFGEIKEVKRNKLTHKLLAVKGDSDYDDIEGELFIDYPDMFFQFELASDKSYIDICVLNGHMANTIPVNKFDLGKYPLSIGEDGKIQTKSGYPAEGWKGLSTWENLIKQEYGEGACVMDWHYFVVLYLYLIEFADFNSQSVLGERHSRFRYSFANDKSLLAEENTNRIVINTTGANSFSIGQRVIVGKYDGDCSVAKYRKVISKENYSQDGIEGVSITLDGEPFTTTTTCSITSCAQDTGSTDGIQASSGCMINDGKHGSCYRGLEFNSIYDWILGILVKNNAIYVCKNPENYSTSDINESYELLDYTIPQDANSGYIKTLGFDRNNPFFMLQTEYGGGTSTHITDYGNSNTANGIFGCRVGGAPSNWGSCGLFYFSLSASPAYASWACGARVLIHQL